MTGTSTRRRLFGSALLSVLAGLAVSSGCATASKSDYTFSDEPTAGKGGSSGKGGGGGTAGKGSGGKAGTSGSAQGGQGGESADGGDGGEPVGGEGGMSGTGGGNGGGGGKGGKGGTSGAGGSTGGTAGSAGGPTSMVGACIACGGAVGCDDDLRCVTLPGGSERACIVECTGSTACPNGFTCTSGLCLPNVMGTCCIDEDVDGYGSGLTCMGPDCNDADGNVAPGMPEACNGVDDDCDDTTDDGMDETGYRDRCDAADSDLCADGYMVCDGDDLVCDDPQDALVEVCNGDDDNCDGSIDEGLPLATCGLGPCLSTGTTCDVSSCTPGTPRPELCNATDDDCDGDGPDEDDPTTMCTRQYTGATGTGTWACSSSGTCSIASCAANRADVNGVIDDGCECAVDTHSNTCATAGSLSIPRAGSNVVVTGQLLNSGDSDWFLVTFASPGAVGSAWAPTAALAAPAGFLMDVLPASCAATPPSGVCSANGFATASTAWGRNYNAYPATGPYTDAVPRDGGTFRVRVYMASVPSEQSCAARTYSLTLTNP